MDRTYGNREAYDAAGMRLAAHLNTLPGPESAMWRLFGDEPGDHTTAADGTVWIPAPWQWLAECGFPASGCFIEEHGAMAEWDGTRWETSVPTAQYLSGDGQAAWDNDSVDFGYPGDLPDWDPW